MPNRSLLIRKVSEIISQIKNLKSLLSYNQKELLSDLPLLYFAERVMERLVTAAIDINYHIVTDLAGKSPEDYHSSFFDLARKKIITLKLASQLAPSAGLRNMLVHEYQEIDYKIFCKSLAIAQKSYTSYARAIQKYIDKN